jgi:two-component sensor histidine kinase
MGWDMARTVEISSKEPSFAEAGLLLHEYCHRINNEFALAISAISLAAARSTTVETKCTLAAVIDQLENYAQVHHALQMPEHNTRINACTYLRKLCRAISKSKLDNRGIRLVLVAQPFHLDSDRCWRLGLIVSELITNAAHHAFDHCGSVIRIELLPSKSSIRCRVTDDGMSESEIHPGHGLRIIAALAKSLGGTIEQQFGALGSTTILSFPAVL